VNDDAGLLPRAQSEPEAPDSLRGTGAQRRAPAPRARWRAPSDLDARRLYGSQSQPPCGRARGRRPATLTCSRERRHPMMPTRQRTTAVRYGSRRWLEEYGRTLQRDEIRLVQGYRGLDPETQETLRIFMSRLVVDRAMKLNRLPAEDQALVG